MRSSRAASLALVPLAVALAPACGVDTTGMGPELELAAPSSPSPASAPADAAALPSPPPTPGGPVGDPGPLGGGVPADAAPGSDVAPRDGGSDPCDLDRDGHLALGCGGDDCCDVDPRVNRQAKGFFDMKNACDGFDYDCDGAATPEHGTVACKSGFFSCSGDGFSAPAACGAEAPFERCRWEFGCKTETSTAVQRCR